MEYTQRYATKKIQKSESDQRKFGSRKVTLKGRKN